jgi:EpsI family protein
MKFPKLWVVIILMLGTVFILHSRGDVDRVPPSEPLSQMPTTIASMNSVDIPMDDGVLEVLGSGVFLNRVYQPAKSSDGNQVGLFIGYFPTQRSGQSIHSPQNCLPGAGWTFDKSGVTPLKNAEGKQVQVGEYIISNGSSKAEVLYWYQSHGRSIANDYMAKLYMLTDSIRYGRTDAALVRVVTPLLPNEDTQVAHDRAVNFAQQLEPLLPAFIPN